MGTRRAAIVIVAVVFVAAGARGQDDQYRNAKAALMQGRTDEARQLYCGLAASYPNFKNARAMCTMLQTKGNSPGDYDAMYDLGVRLFNDGNYDEAAEAFQKVRGGTHRDDAKDYLLYRLPQARLKAAEAASAPAAAPPAPPPAPPSVPAVAETHATAERHPAVVEKKPAKVAAPQSAGDTALANALTEYYAGQFDRSESDLQQYLQQSPKNSVAQFYLGVCRLTRYYIAPEKSRPAELMAQAQAAFRMAKQAGFNPPEKYVSPKIMQVYAATAP